MTRKDGSLALLVVVVWGLNFVVIKLGLHNMPPLMLAGLRFMLVAFPALLFTARPAIPLRLLLGYGLTTVAGQFAFLFCAIGLACRRGWRRWCCRRKPLPSFWRLRLWRTLTGQAAGGDRAGDLRRAGAGGGEPGGEHVPLVGFMLTSAAALGPAAIFSTKNHVPGDPPANHIAGGVERIDPGAAVYVCLVADRWPAAHAGESTPDRYAGRFSRCFTWRLSPPSSAMVSGARCWGAMKPGGWRRCRCWCR